MISCIWAFSIFNKIQFSIYLFEIFFAPVDLIRKNIKDRIFYFLFN